MLGGKKTLLMIIPAQHLELQRSSNWLVINWFTSPPHKYEQNRKIKKVQYKRKIICLLDFFMLRYEHQGKPISITSTTRIKHLQ